MVKNSKKQLKRNIKLFYWETFLVSLCFAAPVWVAFEQRFFSFSEMALLEALSYAILILLQLPSGVIADLIGRKRVILFGWAVIGASNIFIGLVGSANLFILGYIAYSMGAAFVSGADVSILFDSLRELKKEDEYSKVNANMGLAHRAGLILALLAGGFLYSVNIALPYVLTGLMQLVSLMLVAFMVEPKFDSQKFTYKAYSKKIKAGLAELFKSDYMKRLTVFYVLIGGILESCMFYFNQPLAKEFGYTEAQLGVLFAALYLVSSVVVIALVRKPKFSNRKNVYLGFPIIMGLSMLPVIFFENFMPGISKWILPICLLGITVASNCRFTILDNYTNKEFSSGNRTTAISALNMLVGIVAVVAITVGGFMQEVKGTAFVFLILGVVTLFTVLPSAWSLVREYRRHKKAQKKVESELVPECAPAQV